MRMIEVVCLIFLSIGLACFFAANFQLLAILETHHYWNGPGIDSSMTLGAPNGKYEVLPVYWDNSSVQFPICSHSYGVLHGFWKYDNSSGFVHFQYNEPCFVKLWNNTIMITWR